MRGSGKKHFKSTLKRVAEIKQLVETYYEPGRQDRSKRWVWRTKVFPKYGISEKTFYCYLGVDCEGDDDGQLGLW